MIYLFGFLSLVAFSFVIASAAPYVPTRKRDVERFLALAEISAQGGSALGGKADYIFYDLGCGDGRIPDAAAKRGAKATGLEFSILNYLFCKIFRPRITTRFKNFFKADFSDADLVYMFLSQKAHNKMGEILARQMKPGARIITYVWPIDTRVATKIDQVPGQPNLFLYCL